MPLIKLFKKLSSVASDREKNRTWGGGGGGGEIIVFIGPTITEKSLLFIFCHFILKIKYQGIFSSPYILSCKSSL